jgi:hypothetical protein
MLSCRLLSDFTSLIALPQASIPYAVSRTLAQAERNLSSLVSQARERNLALLREQTLIYLAPRL